MKLGTGVHTYTQPYPPLSEGCHSLRHQIYPHSKVHNQKHQNELLLERMPCPISLLQLSLKRPGPEKKTEAEGGQAVVI